MSKKTKSTTQQTQSFNNTNSFGWLTPPENDDVRAVRDFQFSADPSIGYNFASARNAIGNSFQSPTGGYYSPQMRDSIIRSQHAQLAQAESQAKSEANQALQGAQFGQRAAVAGMTAPRMVNTGSSGSGTSQGTATQSSPIWGDLLTGIASGAATGAAA